MKRRYFGTDGVRGEYGGPVMNDAFARRLGVAAGRWLAKQRAVSPVVIIGRDTRFSGPALERALATGLRSAGCVVRSAGVVPTPAVSLAVRHFRAALGVVVTASHNPASDNGIKFFGPAGTKLDDANELEIESLIPDETDPALRNGVTEHALDALPAEEVYMEALAAILKPGALEGFKIVVDAGNGAAYRTTPGVLRRFGAELFVLGDVPDGKNINAGCGSQHPARMAAAVSETGACLGLAHDGDADRIVLADETGSVVDGDELLAVLAGNALAAGRLAHRTLVATVQSNLGLKRFMEAAGGKLVQTAVGDRYVVEAMLAGGFNVGGENSGHIICTEISPCGDGLAAALLVLRAMIETGKPLSGLRRGLIRFPQLSRAIRVGSKPDVSTLPGLSSAIRAAEEKLGADGRILVRYSGTESKIRLLVEGADAGLVAELMAALEHAVQCELGEG